ncbi:MAG TPA: TAXI family TRAP transporter solute-binding subunit, partial [Nannocystis sp.]
PEITKGSCENIRRLLEGTLDFALVQYDVAAEAHRASLSAAPVTTDDQLAGWMCKISPELARRRGLRLVAAISDSAVHMLVRRPVRLDDLDDLESAPIFIGKDGSGSFETARVILGAGGHPLEHLTLFNGSADEALAAMGRRELLMMLRTTGRGHADVQNVLDSGLAALNPLPEDVLNRLIDGYPYYRVCPIEPKHYRGGLEFSLPTVCVSAVLLTVAPPDGVEEAAVQAHGDAVGQLLDSLARVADDPAHHGLGLELRYRDFAEREPIPLHEVAAARESRSNWTAGLELIGLALAVGLVVFFGRRALRRRGIATGFAFEGQLSNPLVPFAAFALVVVCSTYLVWWFEHDSNTRLRTLNESFWEMNTFATGNFSAEALKTSGARLVGAVATILGLGLLAWFTAALTNIFAQDQTRLWRRTRDHFVVLNFREDMLPLIRLLRAPGPARLRSLHVVVPDALPKRVRLQLGKIKALTIHYDNPEAPENLSALRLPRASRVIVLGGEAESRAASYDPLRIARAVHQACARDPHNLALQGRSHAARAITV